MLTEAEKKTLKETYEKYFPDSAKKEGSFMGDERSITDKDLRIHEFERAERQWAAKENELKSHIAQAQKQAQEAEEKVLKYREADAQAQEHIEIIKDESKKDWEADAQDWLKHLQHGGCPDGDPRCQRGALVQQAIERGKQNLTLDDVTAWSNKHGFMPPIREIVIKHQGER